MFQAFVRALKTLAKNMVWQYTLKEAGHSKISLCHLRIKMKWSTRTVSSYSYCCGEIDCNEEYTGESGRTFGERFKEHLKTPSPIFTHQNTSGHITSIDNFKIIGREENSVARTIQEAMCIRVNNPTLNKNIRKYNLPTYMG